MLAKPPEGKLIDPITIHMTKDSQVIVKGVRVPVASAGVVLQAAASSLHADGKGASQATIIIRGHRDAPAGNIQEIIQLCQENGFEKFALRAKEVIGRKRKSPAL